MVALKMAFESDRSTTMNGPSIFGPDPSSSVPSSTLHTIPSSVLKAPVSFSNSVSVKLDNCGGVKFLQRFEDIIFRILFLA